MELKITADKKLLEALDKISAAITAAGLYGVAGFQAQIDAAREADERATIERRIGLCAQSADDAAERLADMAAAAKLAFDESAAKPAQAATTTAPTAKVEEEPTPKAEPATAAPAPSESVPAPSRDEVQRLAIVKIQGGQRKGVQELVSKYGVARVGEVPEDKLAAFKAELEALA